MDYYVWGHQNDRLESQRLTHQHFVFTNIFGGLLQPSITADLQNRTSGEPIRIADVACGNCIWAHEVATSELAKQRNVKLTALDLTDELFPLKDERPDNVEYGLWDMYEAPPEQYRGVFDVVNIRLVFGAVKNNNPEPILRNLLQLLQPGGWLQWSEIDFDNPIAPEGSEYLRAREMFEIARGGHSNAWVPKLEETLQDNSMRNIEFISELPKREMIRYWKDNWYIGVANLVRVVKNEKVDEIWAACEEERTEKGMRVLWPTVMAIGRKS